FTVQPTTTTTNLPITPAVAVTVKDRFFNLVPGASVTIALGSNPTSALLSGATLLLTDVSGLASFAELSINKPGSGYTLVATVSSTPDVVQESAPFDVVDPAVITSFVADPTSIFSGGATKLTGSFTGGTGSIDNGVGAVTSPFTIVVPGIEASTPFKLTVKNAAGTATFETANVAVTAPTGWVGLNNAGDVSPNTRVAQPFSLTFDPAHPSNIYAATLTDGVLKTSTGGPPWSETSFPVTKQVLGVAVGHPDVGLSLWASTECNGKLYHSTDAASWTEVMGRGLPDPVVCSIRTAIVLDPSDPRQKTLYAAFGNGDGLFQSTDDGGSWTKIRLALDATSFDDTPTALAITKDGTLFAGTANGNIFQVAAGSALLLTTTDPGQVNAIAIDRAGTTVVIGHTSGKIEVGTAPGFDFGTTALLAGNVTGVAFAVDGTSSGGVITGSFYAVTATLVGGGVFRSVDSGATFTDVTTDLETSNYFAITPQPADGTTLYVAGQDSGFFKRTFGNPTAPPP
ncbi:MAG: WD40/YVTN/BNR-like repeat-containing protein, partial [Myxococcales bacterium]